LSKGRSTRLQDEPGMNGIDEHSKVSIFLSLSGKGRFTRPWCVLSGQTELGRTGVTGSGPVKKYRFLSFSVFLFSHGRYASSNGQIRWYLLYYTFLCLLCCAVLLMRRSLCTVGGRCEGSVRYLRFSARKAVVAWVQRGQALFSTNSRNRLVQPRRQAKSRGRRPRPPSP
jgi:hypothetical protein